MAEIKIHNYGGWVALCFVVQIFWPGIIQCESLLVHFMPITVAVVLSVLGIRQHYKIKKSGNIIDAYEDKKNLPLMHSISTCVIIYPMICFLTLFFAGFSMRFFENRTLCVSIIVIGMVLGLIPGPILFMHGQKKLRQYKRKNKECHESCLCRSVTFWACYIFIALFILATATAIYDFVHRAD